MLEKRDWRWREKKEKRDWTAGSGYLALALIALPNYTAIPSPAELGTFQEPKVVVLKGQISSRYKQAHRSKVDSTVGTKKMIRPDTRTR
ncbi:GM16486 [Drosophila sechellia]|uniref:GM16486 n=1 Tax=Drosophila sechellia TaxID=7238 RepID=B4II31_DROSE|nr:GM16486 [Drosophila sechellia]